MDNNQPLVSVIIPTYKSEATSVRCLKSIVSQTYKNIEIIIVDKFSRDRTIEIAKMFGVEVYQIKAKERSEQMNYGVKRARGKYVYVVGSDFVLEPSVVEEAVRMCEDKSYEAICVHNTSDPTVSFWSRVRKFERDMYRNDELNVSARFLKKDIFKEIGGFDENLVAAEDYDFHNRLLERRYKIGRITAKEIHIGEPKTLREIVRKHFYYGKTIRQFIRKNQERAGKQLSPIRSSYIRHKKEFITNPLLILGFLIYQFVRYLSAGIGYLVSMIKE